MTEKESLAMKLTFQTLGVAAGSSILVAATHRILHPGLAQEPCRHRGEALDRPGHVPAKWYCISCLMVTQISVSKGMRH